MRLSRRTLLAAGLTAPLAACTTAQRRGAGGPVEITFWSALRGSQQVVDAFNSTQTRIKVIFQQIPSGGQGGYAKLSNAARAGNAPDIATIEYPQVPGYAIDGVARDITDLVTDRLSRNCCRRRSSSPRSTTASSASRSTSSRWSCTTASDLFESNGFELPRTWDEYAELAESRAGQEQGPEARALPHGRRDAVRRASPGRRARSGSTPPTAPGAFRSPTSPPQRSPPTGRS